MTTARFLFALICFVLTTGCLEEAPSSGGHTPVLDAGPDSGTVDGGDEDSGPSCDCSGVEVPDNAETSCSTDGVCEVSCVEGATECDGECVLGTAATDSCGCEQDDCSADVPNGAGACLVNDDVGSCGIACDEGWVDLNDDAADGCECPDGEFDFTATTVALPLGCDSFASNLLFVERGAAGDGASSDNPAGTVREALTRNPNIDKPVVLVKRTDFESPIIDVLRLDSDDYPQGLSIYGGRDEDWSVSDGVTLFMSREGSEPTLTMRAFDASSPVRLDRLTLVHPGRGETPNGASSVTVRLEEIGSGGLNMTDIHIESGPGAPGADGAPATNGTNGHDGRDGDNLDSNNENGAPSICGAAGGNGALALPTNGSCPTTGRAAPGSAGKHQAMPNFDAEGGLGGFHRCAGSGADNEGKEGAKASVLQLSDADPAAAEQPASSVYDPTTGTLLTVSAEGGEPGLDGIGGGGGGAGGSGDAIRGGNGGGGGAGGCGGGGGGGGQNGGDSIAVLMVDSVVDFSNVTINLAIGGRGGDGAAGGCGGYFGVGGEGEPGGLISAGIYGGDGGDGGNGTIGLPGAGGAGGHGGASIGVAYVGTAPENLASTQGPTMLPTGGTGGFFGTLPAPGDGGQPSACSPVAPSPTRKSEDGNSGAFHEQLELPVNL